eukprot:scaffold1890_cov380-Prasinococcus_capsulatus_cf.AAC.14
MASTTSSCQGRRQQPQPRTLSASQPRRVLLCYSAPAPCSGTFLSSCGKGPPLTFQSATDVSSEE